MAVFPGAGAARAMAGLRRPADGAAGGAGGAGGAVSGLRGGAEAGGAAVGTPRLVRTAVRTTRPGVTVGRDQGKQHVGRKAPPDASRPVHAGAGHHVSGRAFNLDALPVCDAHLNILGDIVSGHGKIVRAASNSSRVDAVASSTASACVALVLDGKHSRRNEGQKHTQDRESCAKVFLHKISSMMET